MRVPARIASMRRETPTVISFVLDLAGRELGFRAGQWVDLFVRIGGAEAVAGFSITSSPANQGRIELAVKLIGDNPATHYMHEGARVGDDVEVQLGGEFYYTAEMADSLVLIAGGIGLTPLMSIVRYVDESAARAEAVLLYSAATPLELLFRDQLDAIVSRNPRIRCVYTVTRPGRSSPGAWDGHTGRIGADLLRRARVDPGALYYVCGPPPMIRNTLTLLQDMGVKSDRVHYEQWW